MNACSIPCKVKEVVAQLAIGRYHTVGTTESWLKENQSWVMNNQGYTSYCKGREVSRGVVRNEIQFLASNSIASEGESLWIELRNFKGKETLMGVIYRPPNSSLDVGYKLHSGLEKA